MNEVLEATIKLALILVLVTYIISSHTPLLLLLLFFYK